MRGVDRGNETVGRLSRLKSEVVVNRNATPG
jgi:hypothetical protein